MKKMPPSKNKKDGVGNNAPVTLACGNAFTAPQVGESGLLPNTLTIPYGQWPHGEREHNVAGRKMRLNVMQVFNKEGAIAVANSIAAKRAKGHPGIPVYQGHPDAPEFAASFPNKAAIGWITGALANANGLDLTIDWVDNPGRGFAFFTPYWTGASTIDTPPANGKAGTATLQVANMLSLGLINEPNIEDFRLPNAAGEETNNPKEENTMFELLKELGLAETATEQEAIAALNKIKADLKTATDALAASATAKEEVVTALANARKLHNDHLIADALANGQITGAEKAQWELRLANAFDAEAPVLAALPKRDIKTTAETAGRKSANATGNGAELMALANAKMKENPGMDFDGAWKALKKERPELFTPPKAEDA